MNQELIKLRQTIISGEYADALTLIDEMEDMNHKAVIRNIRSKLVWLMLHLMKNSIEQRLVNAWAAAIRSAILEIQDLNCVSCKRKEYNIDLEEWQDYLEESFEDAIYAVAANANEERYGPSEIVALVDSEQIYKFANQMISDTYVCSRKELSARINDYLGALPGGDVWQKK